MEQIGIIASRVICNGAHQCTHKCRIHATPHVTGADCDYICGMSDGKGCIPVAEYNEGKAQHAYRGVYACEPKTRVYHIQHGMTLREAWRGVINMKDEVIYD